MGSNIKICHKIASHSVFGAFIKQIAHILSYIGAHPSTNMVNFKITYFQQQAQMVPIKNALKLRIRSSSLCQQIYWPVSIQCPLRCKYHNNQPIDRGTGMASVMKVIFELNTSQGSRIKQISMHPIKDWIGTINENNTFSLWNYQEKILIKSFSCNTLDDNKQVEIKEVVFYDKYSLCLGEDCRSMKNNIIFVTNNKLIFYDYITDSIRQTSEKDLEQKSIRKVCVYSQTKICIAMNDGSFKVLDTQENQTKGSMSIRTVRGFHAKPINWIFAYSQNYNEMPRIITASDQDGLMACWNIEMILKSPSSMQVATPSFKFQSGSKKGKESVSNQEILSLQYDPSTYKLITVNDSLIRLWSTMTGVEIKRIKNTYKFRELVFFNHFTYFSESFVAHSKNSRLMLVRVPVSDLVISQQIELKNFFSAFYNSNPNEQPAQLTHIYSLPQHPSHIFLTTNFNMSVIELDKFYSCPFGVHTSFFTRLSTINSRDLINKTEGEFRKNISAQEINGLKFEEEILTNSFYLAANEDGLRFILLEIQYATMLHEMRNYKMHAFDPASLFHQAEVRSTVLVNFEGNEIIVYNKLLYYYEIYEAYNEHEAQDLLGQNHDVQNRIDYYTKFQLVGFGYCRDIIYHQYKKQYAVIAGFDEKDRMVEHKRVPYKKGQASLPPQPAKFRVLVYEKVGKKYNLVERSNPYTTKVYKLFGFGSYFGYSITKENHELIDFISSDKGILKEIEGVLSSSEQVYSSYCESYFVMSYDKYFIVLKVQENGTMSYFRTFEYTILHGYFWEKFFFFLTETALYFMQVLNDETIIIKIAETSRISIIQKIINDVEDDDFEPEYQILPVGQLQIAGIVNMSIVLINEQGSPSLVSLMKLPYIVFCLEVASGTREQTQSLYSNASANIMGIMRETMTNYGLIADFN